MNRCETPRPLARLAAPGATPAPETFCTSGTSPTVHLVGAGAVGRELLRLLRARGVRVVGLTDSSATVFARTGLDTEELGERKARGGALADVPGAESLPVELAIDLVEADIVVDAASVDPFSPYPAIVRGDAALRRGASLVLASKAAVATAGARWLRTAPGRVGLNAVLGGTGARLCAEVGALSSADGVALAGNATTTAIVETIERGGSVRDGIAAAQARGLCEPDPELDLSGVDAALKLAVVLAALRGAPVSLDAIARADVRALDPELVRARTARGRTTRLVARWEPGTRPRVAFEELDRCDPLAAPVDRVVYAYALPNGDVRVHVGAGLGPRATAEALLADVDAFARAERKGGAA